MWSILFTSRYLVLHLQQQTWLSWKWRTTLEVNHSHITCRVIHYTAPVIQRKKINPQYPQVLLSETVIKELDFPNVWTSSWKGTKWFYLKINISMYENRGCQQMTEWLPTTAFGTECVLNAVFQKQTCDSELCMQKVYCSMLSGANTMTSARSRNVQRESWTWWSCKGGLSQLQW